MEFQIKTFDELTTRELFEIVRARFDIFVCEEEILDPEFDDIDYDCLHVYAQDDAGRVTSYLRMFPKEGEPGTVQMGRVLTRVHGAGEGAKLMTAAMQAAVQRLNAKEFFVESQKQAEEFYAKLGFVPVSDYFMEAGIPHIAMRKKFEKILM